MAYFRGAGVERDFVRAQHWWSLAFERGEHDAGYNLGILHRRGLGVPRDTARCIELWLEAATAGSGMAQNAMGTAFLNGEGVDYSPIDAYAWFRSAAERGVKVAAVNAELALMRLDEAGQEMARARAEAVSASLKRR